MGRGFSDRIREGIDMPTKEDLDDMFLGYVECALWSSTDEGEDGNGGPPLDEEYGVEDLAEECREAMRKDCEAFAEDNADAIDRALKASGRTWSDVGHDFWLTRNRHGAGFWDGRYDEPEASELTSAAKVYGSEYLYAHDGKIYGHG